LSDCFPLTKNVNHVHSTQVMTTNIRRLWNPFHASKSFCAKLGQRPFRTSFLNIPQGGRTIVHAETAYGRSVSPKEAVNKSLVSGGGLLFDVQSVGTIYKVMPGIATEEKSFWATASLPRQTTTSLAQLRWSRGIYSSSRGVDRLGSGRNQSGSTNKKTPENTASNTSHPNANPHQNESQIPQTPSQKYLHLPHLPKIPHRPTKEELLAAATGFWSRLKLRFKWFSIRSARPWNIDDWSAFVSWFVLGNIVWILVGTTTFFSLVIFSINTVVAQGMRYI
jgi:distribution and morphology protein 31